MSLGDRRVRAADDAAWSVLGAVSARGVVAVVALGSALVLARLALLTVQLRGRVE